MARCRVKLARILNERKRRATLEKEKEALKKRLQALRKFGRAEACMMICDGPDDLGYDDTNVWPSRQEAAAMLSRFSKIPAHLRYMHVVTQDKLLENMLVEKNNELEALKTKHDKMEMEEMLYKLYADPSSFENKCNEKLISQLFFHIDDLLEKIQKKD